MNDQPDMHEDKADYPPVEPISAGLRGRCPRCGEGKLFDGFIKPKAACSNCGLDYSFVDAGDGPVVFVILIAGFIFLGLALWMQVTYDPPLWLQFVLWIPLALIASLALMRMLKGVLITLQYAHKAKPGEIDRG
jgi:uncharacterized protein (DUF983 family)